MRRITLTAPARLHGSPCLDGFQAEGKGGKRRRGGDGGRPRQGEAEGGVEGSIIFLFVGGGGPSLLAIASKDGPPTPTKKENMKPSTPLSAPTLIPLSGRLPGGVKRGGGEGEGVVAEPAKFLLDNPKHNSLRFA